MPEGGIGGTDIRVEEMAKRITANKPPEPQLSVGWRAMRKPVGKRKKATRARSKATPASAPSETIRSEDKPGNRTRFTITLDPGFLDKMRDCVAEHGGGTEGLTLSGLVERAVGKEMDALIRRYHGGKDFPKRKRKVKRGRPQGS